MPADPQTTHAALTNYQLFMIFFVPCSTGIIVSLFGIFAKSKAEKYYRGWQLYNDLREKTEAEFKVNTIQQFTCIRSSIETLKLTKVDRDSLEKEAQQIKKDLAKEAQDIWERVNNHEHGIKCDSVHCTAKNTTGVISNPH